VRKLKRSESKKKPLNGETHSDTDSERKDSAGEGEDPDQRGGTDRGCFLLSGTHPQQKVESGLKGMVYFLLRLIDPEGKGIKNPVPIRKRMKKRLEKEGKKATKKQADQGGQLGELEGSLPP